MHTITFLSKSCNFAECLQLKLLSTYYNATQLQAIRNFTEQTKISYHELHTNKNFSAWLLSAITMSRNFSSSYFVQPPAGFQAINLFFLPH